MRKLKSCRGCTLTLALLIGIMIIGDERKSSGMNQPVIIYIDSRPTSNLMPVEPIQSIMEDPQIESMSISQPIKEMEWEKAPITVLDPPENIYDYFTQTEIQMMERLVEAEATAGNLQDKMNVANVVYNRLASSDFPDTIKGVIFQKGQFSCVGDGRYYKVAVTEETTEAVYEAFMEPDTTKGALFFCNKADVENLSYLKWFNSLQYIMTDDIGHSFYK